VTDADYRRALLLTKIEAQRALLGLELRLARASFHPLGALLSLLGFDGAVGGTVAASVRSVLGRSDGGLGTALVPLLVAALLPLVDRLRRVEPMPGGGGSTGEGRPEKEE
jgi:hypothetical protein